jgi:hypothetical protein
MTAVVAATAVAASAHDHDEHRQMGAHVHGHGTLNIAIDDKQVALELQTPGMDIVGFEHAAKTDAQKAAVDKAKAELAKALELFKLPQAAGCSVKEAKVALEGGEGTAHDHHDHDAHDHDHDKSADKHDHDEHGGHSQFNATYTLSCETPQELASITFGFFDRFAGAQSLTVNVVTGKGQGTYEVTRAKPVLDLAGVM